MGASYNKFSSWVNKIFNFLIKGKRKRIIKIETGMKNSGCEITDKSGVPPLKDESIEEPI